MFSFVQNIVSALEPLKIGAIDSRFEKNNDQVQVDQDASGENSQDQSFNEESLSSLEEGHSNSFSVNSLIYFLEDFLESSLSSNIDVFSPKNQHHGNDISTIKPWLKPAHNNNINRQRSTSDNTNAYAKQAAYAYADRASSTNRIKRDQDRDKATQTNKQDNLHNIYNLIRDLRVLKRSGVTHLNVLDNATFLDGVNSAISMNKA